MKRIVRFVLLATCLAPLWLFAEADRFVLADGQTSLDFTDPHPFWRQHLANPIPKDGEQRWFQQPDPWELHWEGNYITVRPRIIEPRDVTGGWGRRIANDSYIGLRAAVVVAGKDQSGAISRHFGPVTSLISVRPMYEVLTPDGKLVWWATLMRGDPILRFGATFTATKDVTISPRYIVPWNAFLDGKTGRVVAELANALLWRPDRERGPVLSYIWQRKAAIRNLMSRDGGTITFPDVKLVAGESYDYPLVALAQVDADVPYGDMTAVKQWGGKLARLALALPRCDAYFKDLGRQANGTWRVAIYRGYDYLPNDFGFTDGGQFLPLPWCFGTHVTPEFRAGFGTMHLAYGNKPYVITHTSRVTVDLPMPEISDAKLAPDYAHLAGDWLAKGAVMIDDLATTQRTDGTWPQCARMDQYSLARMTLGLMVAYKGFGERPDIQAKIAMMVRKSLDRMLDVAPSGKYRGFDRKTDWDVWCEGHSGWGYVDQELGQAHLFFSLYLYGRYVDPSYPRNPFMMDRVRQMIRFQWGSMDWTGDLWYDFHLGNNAGGAGDGFESDLAMIFPALAHSAGLEPEWISLSSRVAAMKLGALREFDYLPLDNEWGYKFLTPIHVRETWLQEGGWKGEFRGNSWWTVPSVAGGAYGPWYVDTLLRDHVPAFDRMFYDNFEDVRDAIASDDRHWLIVSGYAAEAQVHDPFLAAVKLMRAHGIAVKNGLLSPNLRGEAIWNLCQYPQAMTVINDALARRYPFMKSALPTGGDAVASSDDERAPAYAWKLGDGAVFGVAGYRIKEPKTVAVILNPGKLGLAGTEWLLTDLHTGVSIRVPSDKQIPVRIFPRTSTSFRITTVGGSP